ncbi:MAG: hypothetical protein WAM14_24900 [Candidatus Nitrosopolaris sp.]
MFISWYKNLCPLKLNLNRNTSKVGGEFNPVEYPEASCAHLKKELKRKENEQKMKKELVLRLPKSSELGKLVRLHDQRHFP